MPVQKVNWAAARSSIAPDDVYECELIKATFGESKTNNPKVTFEFKQDDGESNRHFFKDYSLLPNSLWNLRQDLQALGCNPEILEDEDADPADAIGDVINNRAALKIGHHTYVNDQGVEREFNDVLSVMEV